MTLDPGGHVIVAGRTSSADFPTVRPAQALHGGGTSDAFVAKLAPDGSVLLFSTFLGGRDHDFASAVAVDGAGDIYVAGTTQSPDFPVTNDAFDRTCGNDGGCEPRRVVVRGFPAIVPHLDAFVARFSEYGERRFSTFLGGGKYDEARALTIDAEGRLLVAGFTSTDFAGGDNVTCEGELSCPPFVVQLDRTGSVLLMGARLPFLASYAPVFDAVAMALGPEGAVLVGTNWSGTALVGRLGAVRRAPPDRRPPEHDRIP